MAHSILVADDSKTIRKAIEIAFLHEPFDVVFASDGEDAVQKAISLKPSIVLADHKMPGKDGYDVAAALRASVTPVMIMAQTSQYDEAKASAVGASGHIPKPFTCEQLIEAVKSKVGEPSQTAETLRPQPATAVVSTPSTAPAARPIPQTPTTPSPVAARVAAATPPSARPGAVATASAGIAAAATAGVTARLQAQNVSSGATVDDATREIIERVVWEVVPELAETMIREELQRLLS